MTIRDIVILLWRHRLVSSAILVLTGIVGYFVLTAPPLYQSIAEVQFRKPTSKETVDAYERFSVELIFVTYVSHLYLTGPQGLAEVRKLGGTVDFTAKIANLGNEEVPYYNKPYITIRVYDRDPAVADRTRDAAVSALRNDLQARQRAALTRKGTFITTRLAEGTLSATPISSRKSRTIFAISAIGFIALVTGVMIAERFGTRSMFTRLVRTT
ncbi:hypothetical protein [Rhizohabitans arisaemae]|uniref:hypothetical protein n=1 Tax=Rhizohabitans arisaemae TaxID=2720610 RepID=UPI0024B20BB0|nr:hypothetical protein [Rhizohabitans arisaemae]